GDLTARIADVAEQRVGKPALERASSRGVVISGCDVDPAAPRSLDRAAAADRALLDGPVAGGGERTDHHHPGVLGPDGRSERQEGRYKESRDAQDGGDGRCEGG